MRISWLLLVAISLLACSESKEPPASENTATSGSVAIPTESPQMSVPLSAATDNLIKEPVPSIETISAWWKSKSTEEMTIEGDLKEVKLLSKEVAYLVPAGFYGRGRNDISHAVIVRPALREVREVVGPMGREFEILDLDDDGVSEVVTQSVGSGQGSTSGQKLIAQFDDWAMDVLHQTDYEEGCGFIGEDMSCYSKTVSWKFLDLDDDKKLDLVEVITVKDSPPKKPSVTEIETNKFLFQRKKFIEYKDPSSLGKK